MFPKASPTWGFKGSYQTLNYSALLFLPSMSLSPRDPGKEQLEIKEPLPSWHEALLIY